MNSSWNCHIGLQASAWKFPLPITSLRKSSGSALGSHKRVSGKWKRNSREKRKKGELRRRRH